MATLVPTSEDTRIYECAVLLPYGLPQREEQELIKRIEGMFDEVGAKQIAKDVWGRRGISFPIKGTMEALVIIYHFDMDPSRVKEVDQQMRIEKNLLRHLIVKPPKGYQIVKYSELYEKWLKERETREETQSREREERLKEQVAKKAKRQVERTTVERKKTDAEAKPALEETELTEKLDKLISDDTLGL
ncbi:MAG: 30S ribosomal protein S6 [Candidatus Peregrinibacteria bacterium]|nr:30S ribosomal protein S6 [Candidatus Peregrinibacteria bacterium]